jgi:hypothetical protein
MDEEREAPLDELEGLGEETEDDLLVARSSSGGSYMGSGSASTGTGG